MLGYLIAPTDSLKLGSIKSLKFNIFAFNASTPSLMNNLCFFSALGRDDPTLQVKPPAAPFPEHWVRRQSSLRAVGMFSKPFVIQGFRTQRAKMDGRHEKAGGAQPSDFLSSIHTHYSPLLNLTHMQEIQQIISCLEIREHRNVSYIFYSLCVDYKSIPLAFNIIFWRLFCNIKPIEFQFSSYFLFSLKNNQWDLRLKNKHFKLV